MKLIITKHALKDNANVEIGTSVEGAGRFDSEGKWVDTPVHSVAFVTLPDDSIVRAKYLGPNHAFVFTYVEDDIEKVKEKPKKSK